MIAILLRRHRLVPRPPRALLALGLACATLASGRAEDRHRVVETPLESFTAADAPVSFTLEGYTWQPPWGYQKPGNAGRKYPLVVFTLRHEASAYFTTAIRQQYPGFYVTADCSTDAEASEFARAVNALVAEHGHRIDLNRIYLTGFSWGGACTFKFVRAFLARGQSVAAVSRIAGDTETQYLPTAVENTAFWLHVGLQDTSTRIQTIRSIYASIRSHPSNADATERTVIDRLPYNGAMIDRETKILTKSGIEIAKCSEYLNQGHACFAFYQEPEFFRWLFTRRLADSPPDTTAPSVPRDLNATTGAPASTALAWSPSTDNVGIIGYRIFRDGALIDTSATAAFTDTGLAAGASYGYRIAAFDPTGNQSALSAPIVVVVAHDETYTAFTAWVAGNFTAAEQANTAISGPNADPDGCGLSNLARYAFGLPARGRVASPVALTTTGTGSNQRLTLTFTRKGYAPDLQYTVQSSTDLVTWTDLQAVSPGYPKTFPFTDSVALGSEPRRFLRVRITQVVPVDDAPRR